MVLLICRFIHFIDLTFVHFVSKHNHKDGSSVGLTLTKSPLTTTEFLSKEDNLYLWNTENQKCVNSF